MANITLFVPDDIKRRMDMHKDIRWSSAIRTVIEAKLVAFADAEELAGASRLTQKDVAVLTNKVDAATRKHAKARWE
ncbi:MAG: hypothetical protein V1787_01480 [Candidatus Micrarchaeota archaeon]